MMKKIEEAIKNVYPVQAPKLNKVHIMEICVPKIRKKLALMKYAIANYGSYNHFAMIMIAQEFNTLVEHDRTSDIVSIEIR